MIHRAAIDQDFSELSNPIRKFEMTGTVSEKNEVFTFVTKNFFMAATNTSAANI